MRNDERALATELRRLGQDITVAGDDDELIAQVLTRLHAEPAPRELGRSARVREWLRARRRAMAAALAALMIGLALTPPVRATVAEWFGFGGVIVRQAPPPRSSHAPSPPAVGSDLTLRQARELVEFTPVAPTALGPPDGVEVSGDHRMLSLTWSEDGQTVRLDQFDGTLSPLMGKLAHSANIFTDAGVEYLWVDGPHEVVVVNPDGSERRESARLAGRTLIWERAETTLRLEADMSRARAVTIARSVRPIG